MESCFLPFANPSNTTLVKLPENQKVEEELNRYKMSDAAWTDLLDDRINQFENLVITPASSKPKPVSETSTVSYKDSEINENYNESYYHNYTGNEVNYEDIHVNGENSSKSGSCSGTQGSRLDSNCQSVSNSPSTPPSRRIPLTLERTSRSSIRIRSRFMKNPDQGKDSISTICKRLFDDNDTDCIDKSRKVSRNSYEIPSVPASTSTTFESDGASSSWDMEECGGVSLINQIEYGTRDGYCSIETLLQDSFHGDNEDLLDLE